MESTGPIVAALHRCIEWAAFGIELLAVVVILASVAYMTLTLGTLRYLFQRSGATNYERYRHHLGKALLLSLELLVAADVVRTVTLAPTLENVAVLGILVIVRTILSWSLVVELEGRWPWQAGAAEVSPATTAPPGGRD